MNRYASRLLTWVLGAGLLLASAWYPAAAAELKPMVAVSVASYDTLHGDVQWLGQLAGKPDLAPSVEQAAGRLTRSVKLDGIDRTRGGGAAILTDEDGLEVRPVLFLPVTDLPALLKGLEQFVGPAQEQEAGVYLIQAGPIPLFIQEQNGWAYVAQKPQDLAGLPDDPRSWLGGLDKQYRIGVQFHLQNIPEVYRELIQQSASVYAGQVMFTTAQSYNLPLDAVLPLLEARVDAFARQMHEVDTLTLGLAIDTQAGEARLELRHTAVPGTTLATMFAANEETATRLAGIASPETIVHGYLNSKLTDSESALLAARIKRMRPRVAAELAKEKDLADEELRQHVASLLDGILDQLETTINQGHANLGFCVTGGGPCALVVGAGVADGNKIEAPVIELCELLLAGDGVQFEAVHDTEIKGFTIHSASVPLDVVRKLVPKFSEADADRAARLLGDPVQVALGFGMESVYLAMGDSAVKHLYIVAERSQAPGMAPPAEFKLSLGEASRLVPPEQLRAQQRAMVATLNEAPGRDHVRFNAESVANGQVYRIVLEQGLLKLLGGRLANMLSDTSP